MLRRLILFWIRRKLGVRKYKRFRFTNQKSRDYYYFNDYGLCKSCPGSLEIVKSKVSLNWLINDDCSVILVEEDELW